MSELISLNITVTQDESAPKEFRWYAYEGDYDCDTPVGSGSTPMEAVESLIPQIKRLEQPDYRVIHMPHPWSHQGWGVFDAKAHKFTHAAPFPSRVEAEFFARACRTAQKART